MSEFVYPPVIACAKAAFKVMGLRFDIVGSEHIPARGGAVLASNHISYLDFIFDGLAAQPSKRLVRFMAKQSVFANPVAGPLMRAMHHIPVDRAAGAEAFSKAIEALRAGEVVGVFPEATISQAFLIKELKSGAARMAAEAAVPVIPMTTWGGQRIWTKGHAASLRRGVRIGITVGEPLRPSPADDPNEVTAELKTRLEILLAETISRYPDHPRDHADRWWLPATYGGSAPTLEAARASDLAHADGRRHRARPANWKT